MAKHRDYPDTSKDDKKREVRDGFKKSLSKLLTDHNLTHKQFAELLSKHGFEVKANTVDRWTTGEKAPDLFLNERSNITMSDICDFFETEYHEHISIDYLIGRSPLYSDKEKAACEYLGMNKDAIEALRHYTGINMDHSEKLFAGSDKRSKLFEKMITSVGFDNMFVSLINVLETKDKGKLYLKDDFSNDDMNIQHFDDRGVVERYNAAQAAASMVNSLFPVLPTIRKPKNWDMVKPFDTDEENKD